NVFLMDGLEADAFCGNIVTAERDEGESVVSVGIGAGLANEAGILICNYNFCFGYSCAVQISYMTAECAGNSLGTQQNCEKGKHGQHNRSTLQKSEHRTTS